MGLIDADAVFELFKPFKDALDDEKVKSAYIQTLTLIHNAPSIDIVRCKECLHSYEWDSGCGAELVCKVRRCDPADWGSRVEFYVKADDFCSRGEREK